MKSYVPGTKIKIVPISEEEINEFLKDDKLDVVCLYTTKSMDRLTLNIGFPTIASYNTVLGNMIGFTEDNGMYFLSGDFPEINNRPIYIITTTSNYTVDSYSQINEPIAGKHDLLNLITNEKEDIIKRAN